jgi:hypothetical protein
MQTAWKILSAHPPCLIRLLARRELTGTGKQVQRRCAMDLDDYCLFPQTIDGFKREFALDLSNYSSLNAKPVHEKLQDGGKRPSINSPLENDLRLGSSSTIGN